MGTGEFLGGGRVSKTVGGWVRKKETSVLNIAWDIFRLKIVYFLFEIKCN